MRDYCSTCCYVEQEALKKQAAVQEEGLTNEGKHHMLLLHKQVQDKRIIVHEYITGAGLTECVGVFSREKYHYSQGHSHSPFFHAITVHVMHGYRMLLVLLRLLYNSPIVKLWSLAKLVVIN